MHSALPLLRRQKRTSPSLLSSPADSTASHGVKPIRSWRRQIGSVLLLSGLLLPGVALRAQQQHPYTSIVVFGDSLSDTGNVADLVDAKYGVRVPGPYADYTDGRFTDGADTLPAARRYFGVWLEQLSKLIPEQPAIKASLDGGNNYSYGDATTGPGTTVFTLNSSGSKYVVVPNMGQQITEYLATKPRITDNILFVVWGGANNVLTATSPAEVVEGAVEEAADVQRLIQAGARHILIPNLPALGAIPRLNTSPVASAAANEATVLFDTTLATSLAAVEKLEAANQPALYQVDVYALFQSIVANASSYQFDNVTRASQEKVTVDPDLYLFWDDVHPTTHGHELVARAALNVLNPDSCVNDGIPYVGSPCETTGATAAGSH